MTTANCLISTSLAFERVMSAEFLLDRVHSSDNKPMVKIAPLFHFTQSEAPHNEQFNIFMNFEKVKGM